MVSSTSIRLAKAFFFGCLTAFFSLSVDANASMIGDTATISYSSPNLSDIIAKQVTVAAGPEIVGDDASNIGADVLVAGEFIDIGESSIIYRIFGAGSDISSPGYTNAGFSLGDRFIFSDLDFLGSPNAILSGVSIILDRVINVQLGNDVIFDDHSLTLNLGQIGVQDAEDGSQGFGSIRLNLQFEAVPEPGTILLVGFGGALLLRHWIGFKRT